jgi:hypothetical protein
MIETILFNMILKLKSSTKKNHKIYFKLHQKTLVEKMMKLYIGITK